MINRTWRLEGCFFFHAFTLTRFAVVPCQKGLLNNCITFFSPLSQQRLSRTAENNREQANRQPYITFTRTSYFHLLFKKTIHLFKMDILSTDMFLTPFNINELVKLLTDNNTRSVNLLICISFPRARSNFLPPPL